MNRYLAIGALSALVIGSSACRSEASNSESSAHPRIVVTYSVLGSVVKDVVGDAGDVVVLMPNGADRKSVV